jgi:hypothetical protein
MNKKAKKTTPKSIQHITQRLLLHQRQQQTQKLQKRKKKRRNV